MDLLNFKVYLTVSEDELLIDERQLKPISIRFSFRQLLIVILAVAAVTYFSVFKVSTVNGNILITQPYNVPESCPDGGLVFGMFNTGTNLMKNMIYKYCKESKLLWRQQCKGRIWKHALWSNGTTKVISKSIPYIIIVKDPLTWFKSICKSSYDLELESFKKGMSCEEKIFSKWKWEGKEYDGLFSIWGDYYRLIWSKTKIHKIKYVRYEDLLADPVKEMKAVCQHMNLSLIENEVHLPAKASKSHGSSNNLQSALEKYLNPGYRYGMYSRDTLLKLMNNGERDMDIVKIFGYEFKDTVD